MIVIAGTITLDPTKRVDALTAAREIMRETHKEPGNVAYTFTADIEDDSVIHIFEEWESQAALDFHFKTPHMAKFQKQVGGLGVKDMKLKKYEVAKTGPVF